MKMLNTDTAAARASSRERLNTLDTLDVIPTGAALGAEIRGLDLSRPVPEEVKEALRKAWADHMVLLFRDQHIDDEQLLATSGIFGPPHEAAARKYYLDVGTKVDNAHTLSRHASVSIIANVDKHGNPVRENSGLGSLEVVWHSDNSYVEVPPAGSMLYSLEVPTNGGGDTSFNNQYLAYDELPAELKRAIEGKYQVHDATRNSAGVLRPGVTLPTRPEEVPGPKHPLVRVHPVTGKRALYLGRRRVWPSNYIIGLPNEESETLLDKLWAHATQPKYAWTHIWRVGDIVLWDNRCCMHYRTEIDHAQRRIMHRTTIKGEPVVAPR
ncbi:MAG: TauD/TfdA family dioxygenase [Betaproteobacteria bacterium]|nr:TauD/TfdA family dioxygenase [Betaproteobacteria bacterium]MDH3436211.1 TauD/TfdA family dioxygenase [Betaproteobacteria bacterium]